MRAEKQMWFCACAEGAQAQDHLIDRRPFLEDDLSCKLHKARIVHLALTRNLAKT